MENTLAVNRQGACDEDAFPNINRLLVIAYTLSRSRSDRHALLREIRGRGRRDMPASLCKGSSKKVLSSQSVCLLFTRLFNQTTIVVALYSQSVLNDSVSYLTNLYQSEVKMKKIDIFKHYPPPSRIPLALSPSDHVMFYLSYKHQ